MLLKYSLTLFGKTFNVIVRLIRQKNVLHFGIGNKCNGGLYVIFMDYDYGHKNKDFIIDEITFLQDKWDLGNAYLFTTKNGYHVMFLEKYSLGELMLILNDSSCDKNYKDIPLYYARRMWILRATHKKDERITYDSMLPRTPRQLTLKSTPHANFIKDYYKVPTHDIGIENFDEEENLIFASYRISEKNN